MLLGWTTTPIASVLAEAIDGFFPPTKNKLKPKDKLRYHGKGNRRRKVNILWNNLDRWESMRTHSCKALFSFSWASNIHGCVTSLKECMEERNKSSWVFMWNFSEESFSASVTIPTGVGEARVPRYCAVSSHTELPLFTRLTAQHWHRLPRKAASWAAEAASEGLAGQTSPWDGSGRTNPHLGKGLIHGRSQVFENSHQNPMKHSYRNTPQPASQISPV